MAATGTRWVLLIYTLPARPTRLRAAVWRQIKQVGAVYLRDGVCALPALPGTEERLADLASRVTTLGGEAALVSDARLDPARAARLVADLRRARSEEYAELTREAAAFVDYVAHEAHHRLFGAADRTRLSADAAKLAGWFEQIRARDHLASPGQAEAERALAACQQALALVGGAGRREGTGAEPAPTGGAG